MIERSRRNPRERFLIMRLPRTRKHRLLTITGVTIVLGLAGVAASSATQASPQASARAAVTSHATPLRWTGTAPRADGKAETGNDCGFQPAIPLDRYKGLPDYTAAGAAHGYIAHLYTSQGEISFRALVKQAPCTTFSFRFLAQRGFFTGTHCHRLTIRFLYVLQCGDPTGTGSGGPGYKFNDENLSGADGYPAGMIAMANAGPDTNGSQFFFNWKASPLIPPDYTPFGIVTQGMNILRRIASAGDDSQNSSGDGYPNLFVKFERISFTMTS
jgi:peptidyl-prolyl cis-trans isomerase B (cyclophilin B)